MLPTPLLLLFVADAEAAPMAKLKSLANVFARELSKDYERNKPIILGKIKLTDFAKDFAAAFTKN